MEKFKSIIKRIWIVKKARVIKWKKKARAELFTSRRTKFLEENPEKIYPAIKCQLEQLSDKGKEKLDELEFVFQQSPMSKRVGVDAKKLKLDMLFWHFAYGFTFYEYASYHFIDKRKEERHSFLSDRDIICLCYDYNDLDANMLLMDKFMTYKWFEQYYGREIIMISQEDDYGKFISFTKRHHKFVKKDPFESCGKSVELIDLDKISDTNRELFNALIIRGKVILEEIVVQSNELRVFNSSSVNTVRCITFYTNNGIKTQFFFLKTGRAGMFIDNGAAGGIMVAVDNETGILGTATDEFGNRFDSHPDSGVKFVGFQLPDWDQLKTLCCEISYKLPRVKIIGWDLAHTNNGWVVIEGNSMTEIIGPQSSSLKGKRKEIEMLLEM